jgi:hypothetical protein
MRRECPRGNGSSRTALSLLIELSRRRSFISPCHPTVMRRTIRRDPGTFDPSRDLGPNERDGLGRSETTGLYVPLDFVLIRTVVGGSPLTTRIRRARTDRSAPIRRGYMPYSRLLKSARDEDSTPAVRRTRWNLMLALVVRRYPGARAWPSPDYGLMQCYKRDHVPRRGT